MKKLFFRLQLKKAGEGEADDKSKAPPVTPPVDDGSGNPPTEDKDKQDLSALPEWAQKNIKDLRAENAKNRNNLKTVSEKLGKFENGFKAMFGEKEDQDPTKQISELQGNFETVATRNAILELAIQNGISGSENVEYFEFLMSKQINSLQEGEEMSDESIAEIISKCSQKGGTKPPADTSTKDKGDQKPPAKNEGEVTPEEFDKMTIIEKSKLYRSNPELYNKLFKGN